MLDVSKRFKQELYNENRDFINTLAITLADGTELTVTNEHIMQGGVLIDDAVSEDDSFTAVGSTIINSATLILYNNDEIYSDYDFTNATVIVYTALNIDGTPTPEPPLKKGTFTIDNATYNNATITLTAFDNMEQFDRPYSLSELTYPTTLLQIVLNACSECGVTLANSSLNFPHNNYRVTTRPSEDVTTFRDVISYCAMIAGCFARCNVNGKLEFKWFDTETLYNDTRSYDGGTFDPWTEGDTLDGGTFNPWTTGTTLNGGEFTDYRPVHYITGLYSQNLGVDDVIITGVKINVDIDDPDSDETSQSFMDGTDDYLIEFNSNPFITVDTAPTVLGWLSDLLVGLQFRKCNCTHDVDPTIEAGDVGFVWDAKNVEHKILITRVNFNPTSPQTIVCGADTALRNGATRFSALAKTYKRSRKELKAQKDLYDQILDNFNTRINNAKGLYTTEVQQTGGGSIRYFHDKPNLAESDVRMVISSVGITVTANGRDDNPTWYGLTVDGTLVMGIVAAEGIVGNWIQTGLITSKNGRVYFDLDNNELACGKLVSQTTSVWQLNRVIASIVSRNAYGRDSISYAGGLNVYNEDYPAKFIRIQPGYTESGYSAYQTMPQIFTGRPGNSYYQEEPEYAGLDIYAYVSNGNEDPNAADSAKYDRSGIRIWQDGWMDIGTNVERARTTGSSYPGATISMGPSRKTKVEDGAYYYDSTQSAQMLFYANRYAFYGGPVTVQGTFSSSGSKSRCVNTKNYDERLLYCYEMASPMFGDIGEGVINEQGKCIISFDDIFLETTDTSIEYQVFLQKEGNGDLWVNSKYSNYFIVEGTPNLKFSWEIKCKQKNFKFERLDELKKLNYEESVLSENESIASLLDNEEYINGVMEVLYENEFIE